MTHVTCRLTAKYRDQLRNHTLGNRVWATFIALPDRNVPYRLVRPRPGRAGAPRCHGRVCLITALDSHTHEPRKLCDCACDDRKESHDARLITNTVVHYAILNASFIINHIACLRVFWPEFSESVRCFEESHVDASCFWNVTILLLHPSSIRCPLNSFLVSRLCC